MNVMLIEGESFKAFGLDVSHLRGPTFRMTKAKKRTEREREIYVYIYMYICIYIYMYIYIYIYIVSERQKTCPSGNPKQEESFWMIVGLP